MTLDHASDIVWAFYVCVCVCLSESIYMFVYASVEVRLVLVSFDAIHWVVVWCLFCVLRAGGSG
jgi:hypothetical protein